MERTLVSTLWGGSTAASERGRGRTSNGGDWAKIGDAKLSAKPNTNTNALFAAFTGDPPFAETPRPRHAALSARRQGDLMVRFGQSLDKETNEM
jgi:hypothetical protein